MTEIRKTSTYPTRYAAFDNPRIFWINETIKHTGGYEFAVFHAPMPNAAYPHITDGLYISVISYQGKQIMVDYHFTAPNSGRQQKGLHKMFPNADYQEAINYALRLAGHREGQP